MTIVAKSTIDRKTGDLYMQVLPQEFDSRQKAHDAMREEYFKELKKLGLEDNDAMDETCEESCEGGYIDFDEAEIFAFTDYAPDKLLPVACLPSMTESEVSQWLKSAQKKSFRRKLRRNAERIATLTRKPATQQRTLAHPHTVLLWETGCRLDIFLTVLSKK